MCMGVLLIHVCLCSTCVLKTTIFFNLIKIEKAGFHGQPSYLSFCSWLSARLPQCAWLHSHVWFTQHRHLLLHLLLYLGVWGLGRMWSQCPQGQGSLSSYCSLPSDALLCQQFSLFLLSPPPSSTPLFCSSVFPGEVDGVTRVPKCKNGHRLREQW